MGEVFICIYWGSVVSEEKANIIPPIRFFHLFHHTSPVRPLRTLVQNFSIVHETHLENLFNFCILKIQLTRRPEKKQFRSNQILLFYSFQNPFDHSHDLFFSIKVSLYIRYYFSNTSFLFKSQILKMVMCIRNYLKQL